MVVASPSALERSGLLMRITATEDQRHVSTKKAASPWSNESEPGHNRGDELPADDKQLPSVG